VTFLLFNNTTSWQYTKKNAAYLLKYCKSMRTRVRHSLLVLKLRWYKTVVRLNCDLSAIAGYYLIRYDVLPNN